MKKLYVFDVDGTLVGTKSGATFRESAQDWQWLPRRIEKCQQLVTIGAKLALASNQGGVCFPWSKMSEAEITAELIATGAQIGAQRVYVACSTPNAKALPQYYKEFDERRKPGPGMLVEAMKALGVAKEDTVMIGDRPEDEGAAKAAGVDFIHANIFFANSESLEIA